MSIDKLKELLKNVSDVDQETISEKSSLKDDLHLTSFSFMMLLVEMEETLGQSINPCIFQNVNTVEDLLMEVNKVDGDRK